MSTDDALRTATAIRPIEAADLEAAGRLLADRHRRHRLAEPLLDPRYEDPAEAMGEIQQLLGGDGAGGWIATRDGDVTGFVVGISKDEKTWGRNVWVEPAGHAAADGATIRALYAVGADAWAQEERFNHHVLVPASDAALVDAWFTLDFGQQHLHAVREAPPASFGVAPRAELIVRRATADDLPALAELELVLPNHMRGAPVFSRLPIQAIEEILEELRADWDDPKYTIFVAEHENRVVGDAIALDVQGSSGNSSLIRPAHAGFLGYAAVLPSARGLGVGRAVGEAVLAWSRDAGYEAVTTDWRSTNIEADRAWRSLGFRPTFRRLHRAIT
ncbi:MAG TPA: GNAT family N-acetyltransferase [Candidatus Limnocylindria bacterium]|nr:GNAT family N-acetyltransferase [Candidatus Limnocylindria bacterium]